MLIVKYQEPEPKIVPYEERMDSLISQYDMKNAADEQLQEWRKDNNGLSDLAHAAWGVLIDRGVEQPKCQGYGEEWEG